MKKQKIIMLLLLMAFSLTATSQQQADHARALPYQGTWGVRILAPTAYDKSITPTAAVNAENFDIDFFMSQIDQLTTISYVMINVTRGHQASWYSGPYPEMAAIMGDDLFPQRDFLGELATALQARGLKVLVYFSVTGMDSQYLTSAQMNTWNAYLASEGLTHNEGVAKIMEYYSVRYGDKIDGWWVDRVYDAYNNADHLRIATALRKGNPDALVTMHRDPGFPIIQNNQYCDYTAGHPVPLNGRVPNPSWTLSNVAMVENIEDGPWIDLNGNPDSSAGTALGHVLMPFQRNWRDGAADFPTEQAKEWTLRAMNGGGMWTWAVARIDNGFAEPQFSQLVEINEHIIQNGTGGGGNGGNLALNRSAAQSTTLNGAVASRANDGNTAGNFGGGSVSAAQGPNAWWEVNLGGNYDIDDINIFNRTDGCCSSRLSDFTVSVINSSGTTTYSQTVTSVPAPSTTINAGGATGQVVRVQSNTTTTLNLAEVQVFGEPSGSSGGAFVPNPNKTYHIDNPYHNLRLAATGSSEDAYTTSTSTTGTNVEWKFVDNGNGYWHLDRAAGGTKPRLRTDGTENADMNQTAANGTKTYYEFSEGASNGTYFLTLPDGPADFNRLQITNTGEVKMVPSTANGVWVSFTITEASTSTSLKASLISVEDTIDDEFIVYPNPVSNMINFDFNGSKTGNIEVIDDSGRIVFSGTAENGTNSVDLSTFPSGLYILKVDGEGQTFAKKIIKNN